jgi:bacillithiol biosynthesis cysteine-adding enzyme BshC
MQLAVCDLAPSQPLATSYIHHFSAVRELFDHNPWDSESLKRRADRLLRSGQPRADRAGLIEALAEFNRRLGNAPEALDNISRLANANALAVVGGQQAGLFTGPLMVIYKAITILKAARRAEERLGHPVVPVFWIAGEDHDFEEINHLFALTPELKVEKIRLEARREGRIPISRLEIEPDQWKETIERFEKSLMDTEFKPDLMALLRETGRASRTPVECFGRIMARLFGSRGLVLLDSDDPRLRALEGPMFRRLIDRNEALNEALLTGRSKVERLGFAPQSEIAEGQANLFVFDGDERVLLHRQGNIFSDKNGKRHYSLEQLLDLADTRPQHLSNNVMTRPLMQEFLLPVLATVLGPGEIAYWALTRDAFHVFEMEMPVVIPRDRYTLIEGTLQKSMQKFGLSLDDVAHRFEEKRQAWLDAQDSLKLAERFAAVREQVQAIYRPLLDDIARINPGLRNLGETNLQKIFEQIGFMEARANDAFTARFDASLRQMDRLKLSLFPLNQPQERVYNVFSYLNKYGDGWLDELIGAEAGLTGQHYVCYF